MPLERQATFLHQRLSKYLLDVQDLDKETLKRYKRLVFHMVMNKMDPLQLDEFKFSFLSHAVSDNVSVTVRQLRQIIRHVLNNENLSYEERFIQALVGPQDDQGITDLEDT